MRIIILGTGSMAANHAQKFAQIPGVEIVATVDRNPENLKTFSDRFGISRRFGTLEEAITWGDFDAASNVTPDAVHYATSMALIAAGKHVLCEKPLATNHVHAFEMAEAAERAGVINSVNLSYRDYAAIQKAHDMVAGGEIGRVRHVTASYLQSWLTQPAWGEWSKEERWLWRLSTAHGSLGVLGDVGVHIIDFASFGANLGIAEVSCKLKTFDKAPGNRIGDYVLDANDSFAMTCGFDNGAIGTIDATRFATGHLNDLYLRVFGDKGGVEVGIVQGKGTLRVSLGADVQTGDWKNVALGQTPSNYERFARVVAGEKVPHADFRRAAQIQLVMDQAVKSDGERRSLPVRD